MPDVKNSEFAKSSPTDPAGAAQRAMGEYKDTETPLDETAAKALPLANPKDPWKNVTSGGK